MKEQTPTIEIEGPRWKSHYDEAWRAGTEDGAKRIKALRNAVHKNRLEVQQSSAMSKDTRSDEVVRDHGIRRHWSEKPAGVLEGASPEQT